MATGDNLNTIGRYRNLHSKLPNSAKLKATIAMTSLSSAITQAGKRRSEEAEKQLGRGIAEASSFIGLGPTNGNIVAMHAVLMEMVGQATAAVQQFAAAAKRHNLPSVDTRGNILRTIQPFLPDIRGEVQTPPPSFTPPPEAPRAGVSKIAIAAAVIVTIGGIFFYLKTTGKI